MGRPWRSTGRRSTESAGDRGLKAAAEQSGTNWTGEMAQRIMSTVVVEEEALDLRCPNPSLVFSFHSQLGSQDSCMFITRSHDDNMSRVI